MNHKSQVIEKMIRQPLTKSVIEFSSSRTNNLKFYSLSITNKRNGQIEKIPIGQEDIKYYQDIIDNVTVERAKKKTVDTQTRKEREIKKQQRLIELEKDGKIDITETYEVEDD